MIALYRFLLLFYPKAFREEYAGPMLADFRLRWAREGSTNLALSTVVDTLRTAAGCHAEMLAQDLRFGARTLRQNRAFALSAIVTLALAIGATTAIFSLVQAVMLRPLPLAEPERIVRIFDTNQQLRISGFASSEENFQDWAQRTRTFASMAALQDQNLNLNVGGLPERVQGFAIQGDFWKTIGAQPLLGRIFTPDEHVLGRHRVVLLGEGLWRRAFAGDPQMLGRSLELSGHHYTVVGVAPAELGFGHDIGFFTPLPRARNNGRGDRQVAVLGRLRPGVTVDEAATELKQLAADLAREHPDANRGWSVRLQNVREWILEPAVPRSVLVLFGAVGLLLLLACANVANLLLARAAARQREIGVRLALGASRARLMRQVITESLLLGVGGGMVGVALAFVLVQNARTWLPSNLVAGELPEVNAQLLAFAGAVTLMASLVFGSVPALLFWRDDVRASLNTSRSTAAEPARWRQMLAVGQLALAVLLLTGALLLARSFTKLMQVELGFRQDQLLTARFTPPPGRVANEDQLIAYYDALLREASALAGVKSAAIASEIPLGPARTGMPAIAVERASLIATEGTQAAWRIVTPGYFATFGIPVLRGGIWSSSDAYRDLPVLISDTLRRKLWEETVDPIGRRLRLGNGRNYLVVGVAGDVRHNSLTSAGPTPTVYLPPWFTAWPTMTIALRTNVAEPAALTQALRQAVRRVEPGQPVYDIQTMDAFVSRVVAGPRLATGLLGMLALLALVLAAVGVAGLASYAVARQRPELALRLALGATPSRLIRNVVGSHLVLCSAGLALGLAAAWWLRPVMATLLFEVQPGDPLVFAAAGTALLAAACLAAWIPARHVTRIDPAAALRGENS